MIRTLYVIHHSHTDIGYTHGQSRIIRWHGEYIRQAMDLVARRDDFKWQCETFFPVEAFWRYASEADRSRYVSLVRAGKLGLSGSYFNYTELADADLLRSMSMRARTFADTHQLPLRAAMTADINGTTLSHARALADAGIELLVTFIHPHHGFVPLRKRAAMYDWDLADGRTLTVVHSDHYHIANELGMVPGAATNYAWLWDNEPSHPYHEGLLEKRLPLFLKRIEADGWDAEWFVIAGSGLLTDNAPPSELLADRIARWNASHAEVHIEVVTLNQLVDLAKQHAKPTLRGDCPDWWADGVAGDPEAVALFRHALRQRRLLADLGRLHPTTRVDLTSLDESLALYAEHTSGHAGSVRHPSNLNAHQLRSRKVGYAAEAADLSEALLDAAVEAIGCGPNHANRPLAYRIINVSDHVMRELVTPAWEWSDGFRWLGNFAGTHVVRLDTNATIPHQVIHTYRGGERVFEVELAPGESVDIRFEGDEKKPFVMNEFPPVPDRAMDLVGMGQDVPRSSIRTKHVEIDFSAPLGITAWRDASGNSLINGTYGVPPFAIRASRLHGPMDGDQQCDLRRRLGRNRNGRDAAWSTSRLKRVRGSSDGALVQIVDLEYELEGCETLALRLLAYHERPRVDVEVTMHKIGTWDAENLYLALPFVAGEGQSLHLDRGTGPMRPGVDQIPGTLVDFYGVQDGIAWTTAARGIAVAQRDSHLVQVGPLGYGERELATGAPVGTTSCIHAWLMTNYWETNFAPELGGFYSFRFSVLWGEALRDPIAALRTCRDANAGIPVFRHAAPVHKC
jgi:hypothetical protein